jgi:hypothetical protein
MWPSLFCIIGKHLIESRVEYGTASFEDVIAVLVGSQAGLQGY